MELKSDAAVSAIPFLTKKGCTVEPYLRPLCSLWLCPEAEEKAPEKYWSLKAEIMASEIRLGIASRKKGETKCLELENR